MFVVESVFRFEQRRVFERNVLRALGVGSVVGVAFAALGRLEASALFCALLLAAVLVVNAASGPGHPLQRVRAALAGALLPALPLGLNLTPSWTIALSGCVAGLLFARASELERKQTTTQVEDPWAGWRYGVTGVLTGVLGVAGIQVGQVLASRLLAESAPGPIAGWVQGGTFALFAALGSSAAHVVPSVDPVIARGRTLASSLRGDFAEQVVHSYSQCLPLLQSLASAPGREALLRTLGQLTDEATTVAAEWSKLDGLLAGAPLSDIRERMRTLEAEALREPDEIARTQLLAAATSLGEQGEKLEELARRRARVVAKLRADSASLESTRISLTTLASSQTQLRAAELSVLTRRLESLVRLPREETRWNDALAQEVVLAEAEGERKPQRLLE